MQAGYVVEPRRGMVRPFREWRKIRRGRNKGYIEVVLFNGRPRRVVVDPGAVRKWPEK